MMMDEKWYYAKRFILRALRWPFALLVTIGPLFLLYLCIYDRSTLMMIFYFLLIQVLNLHDFFTVTLAGYIFPFNCISFLYIKLYCIVTNLFETTYEVDLGDITTSFCFNLLLVYQDTNLFIILILTLVYYCLFKIIEDHLYNLYGDEINVYIYFIHRIQLFNLLIVDIFYVLIEELKNINLNSIVWYLNKFHPINLYFLFDDDLFEVRDWEKFGQLELSQKLSHSLGFWYFKQLSFLFFGDLTKEENFFNSSTLSKDPEFPLINFFNNTFLHFTKSNSNYNFMDFSEFNENYEIPFFKKSMYYSTKIKNVHLLYQLFLLADSKNIYSYELNKYNIYGLNFFYYKVFDDTFINFSSHDFKTIRSIALKYHIENLDILPNNLFFFLGEANKAKNGKIFDDKRFVKSSKKFFLNEDYKSHHIKTYIYLFNRSSKYLSSGVPLNNLFSSDRFLNAMSVNTVDTLSFYDVFSIFLNNIFINNGPIKPVEDAASYVTVSEISTISSLIKLGSFNYCQHSLENGPWFDLILQAHELAHSFSFEYAWALFPTGIICYLMAPAYLLLYSLEFFGQAFLIIKILGHQWFWSYEIENNVNNSTGVKFDSNLLTNEEYNIMNPEKFTLPGAAYGRTNSEFVKEWLVPISNRESVLHSFYLIYSAFVSEISAKTSNLNFKENMIHFVTNFSLKDMVSLPRLLSTDTQLILPAEKPILLSICSTDVLHAYALPNFGLKVDAVPGRINTFWLYMNKIGLYYGQCSELCGKGHGFMPIVVDSQAYSNDPFETDLDNLGKFGFIDPYDYLSQLDMPEKSFTTPGLTTMHTIIDENFFENRPRSKRAIAIVEWAWKYVIAMSQSKTHDYILVESKAAPGGASDKTLEYVLTYLKNNPYEPYKVYDTVNIEGDILKEDELMLESRGFKYHPYLQKRIDVFRAFKAACGANEACLRNEYWTYQMKKLIELRKFEDFWPSLNFVAPLIDGHVPLNNEDMKSNFDRYSLEICKLQLEIEDLRNYDEVPHERSFVIVETEDNFRIIYGKDIQEFDKIYKIETKFDEIISVLNRLCEGMEFEIEDNPRVASEFSNPKYEAIEKLNLPNNITNIEDLEMENEAWNKAVAVFDSQNAKVNKDIKEFFRLRELLSQLQKKIQHKSFCIEEGDSDRVKAQKLFLLKKLPDFIDRLDELNNRLLKFLEFAEKQEKAFNDKEITKAVGRSGGFTL